MYTAAEALKLSDCGRVRHVNENQRTYFFDEENKVWKVRYKGTVDNEHCFESSMFFTDKNFLPVMAEKSELEKVKEKYFGKWVKVKDIDMAFKVSSVGFGLGTDILFLSNNLNCYKAIGDLELLELVSSLDLVSSNTWGKGRCCVDDPPSVNGEYYVKVKFLERDVNALHIFENNTWQDYFKPKKGDLWWPLPEGEG